jgi:hypothetical protein
VESAAKEEGVELTSERSEAATSLRDDEGGEPDTASEPEAATEAAPAPKAAAVAEPEEEEEFYNPTAEELAAIEANPELKKVYKSLQKGFTKKTTELKGVRKTLEERAKVADWIEQDPEAVARIIAETRGFKLSKAEVAEVKTEAVDTIEKEWAVKVGPEAAKLLRPLIEKTVSGVLKQEVEPMKAQLAEVNKAAQERGIASAVHSFEATVQSEGEDWDDDIQAEMASRIGRLEPGRDVTIDQYLRDIYDGVIAQRLRLARAKGTRDRLRRIREEQEPTVTAKAPPAEAKRITTDMKDKDAIALAVQQARKEMGARR